MRKVTQQSVNAFYSGREFNNGNTSVKNHGTESYLHLHGNRIAVYEHTTGSLLITNAGWASNTTKERLNGLRGVSIYQKKGVWYLNGKQWDGSWVNVSEWSQK